MAIEVSVMGKSTKHKVERTQYGITVDDKQVDAQVIDKNESRVILKIDGKLYRANVTDKSIILKGHVYNITSKKSRSQKKKESKNILLSPLAGKIIKTHVVANQKIQKGQQLVVIESMKMENEIIAESDGFIKTISISEGDLVQSNQVLMTFEFKETLGGNHEENENRGHSS